jgi:hypothetical protein
LLSTSSLHAEQRTFEFFKNCGADCPLPPQARTGLVQASSIEGFQLPKPSRRKEEGENEPS